MCMYIFITILGIVSGWYYVLRTFNYWEKIGVPQTNSRILFEGIRTVLFAKTSYAKFAQLIYNVYPDKRYVGYYQFTRPTLMIRDPDLIKQITIKDFDHFTDHGLLHDEKVDPLWSKNLFSLKGQKWRNMRATLSGAFTSSKMKIIFSLVVEAAESFTNYFDSKPEDFLEIDFKDAFSRLANDAIASVALGISVDSLKEPNNEIYLMGKQAFNFRSLLKSFRLVMPPKLMAFLNIRVFDKSVADYFSNIVYKSIKSREEQNIFRPDMINVLLQARKSIQKIDEKVEVDTGFATAQESLSTNKKYTKLDVSDSDIAAQTFMFFFGGYEPISTTLSFSTYELAVNPEVQEKLREEIYETLQTSDKKLSYEALLKMKYMDMVVAEILRKWSTGINVDRVCTKPYTIQPVRPDEVPVNLKVGAYLHLPYTVIHWDPKYWPQPEKFIPERFSEENKKNIKSYTYFPFGQGPRSCIGSRYGLLAIKTVLFYLLSKYEIVPSKKSQIPLKLQKGSFLPSPEQSWYRMKRINI